MTEDPHNELITVTAEELMDRQFLPRHSVIDHFLPTGTFILSGQPKIGKSFLMLMLCWCVSEGKPFLGFDTRRSEVLYLTLEDTDARIQERLSRMFGNTDWDGSRLHLTFRTTQNGEDLIQQLQNFVFEHPGTRLIVIDTLYLAREGGNSATYSYGSDYKDIRPFKLFTDAYDLALILVHHTNKKPDEGNPFNQISGTNGLLGAADGGFVLCAEQEKRFLHCIGRDLPMQHYELHFDQETCLWELIRSYNSTTELIPEPLLDMIDTIIEDTWHGSATDLLESIQRIKPDLSLQPNTLTRKLNSLTSRLEKEKGIIYRYRRSSEKRVLEFTRISVE